MDQLRKHNNSGAAKSGPLREQSTGTARIEMHQSQLFKTSQSQRSIGLYKVSRNQLTSSPDED